MNKTLTVAIALFIGGSLLSIATPAPEAKAGLFRHGCCGARAHCHGWRHHRKVHRCSGYGSNGCYGGYSGCHGGYGYGANCSGSREVYRDDVYRDDEMGAPPAIPQEPMAPPANDRGAGATATEPASPSDADAPPPPATDGSDA